MLTFSRRAKYERLSEPRVPHCRDRKFTFTVASKEDHSNSRFWDKHDWHKFLKAPVGATQTEVDLKKSQSSMNFRYLTDENGKYILDISGKMQEFRDIVKATFHEMDASYNPQYHDNPPPATWVRGVTQFWSNVFREKMEFHFPFLALCSHGWKVEELGRDLLPGYRQNHKAPKQPPRGWELLLLQGRCDVNATQIIY